MAVSRRRSGGRVAKRVWGAALSVGARAMQRARGRNSSGAGSGTAVMTNQRDVITTYKGRKGSTRRARRARKWSKSVQKVIYNQAAPTNLIYSATGLLVTLANQGQFYGFTLNGANSSSSDCNDISRVFSNVLATNAERDFTYLDFQSARMNLRLKNVSATSNCTIFIYDIICRASIGMLDSSGNDISSPQDLFTRGLSETEQVLALGRPNATTVGVTPFMAPKFCQKWKIMKVRKVEISPGNFVEVGMTDTKHHEIRSQDYLGLSAIKGWTRGYLIGIIGNANAVGDIEACTLSFSLTKNWNYRIIENNANQSAILV